MVWTIVWAVLGLLVIVAGIRRWLRLRELRRQWAESPALDDAAIRRIERTGRYGGPEADPLDAPDPLDGDAIAAAEEEFWAEEWDEPEEFGRS